MTNNLSATGGNGSSKIAIRGLSKIFETEAKMRIEALADLDLDIADKEFVSVIGPSGCGKTTLLNLVAGLIAPTTGHVYVDQNEVHGPGRDRGVVFQQDSIFLWRTVDGNVRYSLEIAGLPRKEQDGIVQHYLRLVGLEQYAKLYPKELSGGMRKRVAIATAMASSPSVLLMDEPFGNLDYPTKVRLQKELIGIWEREKKTTVFVTHDVEEAIYLSDRIVVLEGGRFKEMAAVPFKRPREDEIRFSDDFVGLKRRLWKYLE